MTPINRRILLALAALATLALSGCYVEYSEHLPDQGASVEDFRTLFLARTALTPYALGAVSIDMLANPDAFLTPSSRDATRSHDPIETTSTYLFENGTCPGGGRTSVEAQGTTETYDDAMTWVELALTARAFECGTTSWLGSGTLNSRLDYDVQGWYDEAFNEIDSLDARLSGYLRLDAGHKSVKLSGLDVRARELSSTDFRLLADAGLWLDDGWNATHASLTTLEGVHWYAGDNHPHAGRVRIGGYTNWVELSFSDSGVSRRDSDGYRDYIAWWELD